MSLYDWLLFLHLLAAFLLVAGLVAFAVMVLGPSEAVVSRTLAPAATALWNAGGLGLWFVGSGSGGRLAAAVREGEPAPAIDGARAMVLVMALSTLLLLLDMIFKPGA